MNTESSNNNHGFYKVQSTIREHEESTKKALQLKRKELKWKLMQASQQQNRARLDEIKAELNYYKKRTNKITALAYKLRAKYLKVAKAAKISESHYNKCERLLLTHEKFVADEKMQLTKLAVDCRNIGTQLYGPSYELVINTKVHPKVGDNGDRNSLAISKKRHKPCQTRLSSLYDLKNSLLRNLASFRLTTKFVDTDIPITDLTYAHNICPFENICLMDLIGLCSEKNCPHQHKSNYYMSDVDKLADILSYKPSLTGFKRDPSLNQDENDTMCRFKLRQYAANILSKNSEKSVETIAQNLVKYVRANKSDLELLTMVRELPKARHLICHKSAEASSLKEETSEENEVSGEEADEISLEDESIMEEDGEIMENGDVMEDGDIMEDGEIMEEIGE